MKRFVACAVCAFSLFVVVPVAHAQSAPPTATTPAEISSHFAGVSPTTSPSRPVGKVLGLIALAVVLVLFSEGFGILGGRIRNLASRPPRTSEEPR
jgi:hypothetical protein